MSAAGPTARARPWLAPGPCSSACRAGRRSGNPAPPSSRRARPKSPILGVPSVVSSTLAGFRSRWTIPPWCAELDRLGQGRQQRGRLAGRQGGVCQFLGQAAPLDILHGEVGPSVPVADVVDLHDVRVAEGGDRLGLALESLPLGRAGVGAGQHHLQGDEAVQAQVPGPVDDAHAAATEHGLDLVAGDLRQGQLLRRRRREAPVRPDREQGIEFGTRPADLPPPLADLGQQFRARTADVLGVASRSSTSSSSSCTRGSSGMAASHGS